ncbi:hypothetical protein Flexsi_1337 [Flexistipes sinusarabici DSM 4947]|uniref:Uncharacterized protein n=1 Tax=Flexistipes sinusarabici (strain ATCC 49648 / DSM 4947 / MAS 10) TaxID=717231 RepID=F8E7K1_FLESM|nr:CRISPR-associated protein Csx20 [Flexistipes sinusarabici]AEI14988.1 hypothetical protein Flexsi_1337 [Flexistipes sinusarabici DSM 4947]
MNFFLVFSHSLTNVQIEDAKSMGVENFFYFPAQLQNIWSNIRPEGDLPVSDLDRIVDWIDANSSKGDFALVQGDFGATYYIVNRCFDMGLIPVYSTTKRIASEESISASEVGKQSVFEHVNFRRYVK